MIKLPDELLNMQNKPLTLSEIKQYYTMWRIYTDIGAYAEYSKYRKERGIPKPKTRKQLEFEVKEFLSIDEKLFEKYKYTQPVYVNLKKGIWSRITINPIIAKGGMNDSEDEYTVTYSIFIVYTYRVTNNEKGVFDCITKYSFECI